MAWSVPPGQERSRKARQAPLYSNEPICSFSISPPTKKSFLGTPSHHWFSTRNRHQTRALPVGPRSLEDSRLGGRRRRLRGRLLRPSDSEGGGQGGRGGRGGAAAGRGPACRPPVRSVCCARTAWGALGGGWRCRKHSCWKHSCVRSAAGRSAAFVQRHTLVWVRSAAVRFNSVQGHEPPEEGAGVCDRSKDWGQAMITSD